MAAAAAEDVAENITEDVAERAAAPSGEATKSSALAACRFKAEAVVCGAFLLVGEDFVGLLDFLELLFRRLRVVRIAVGVQLHGELAVGFFDVVLRGVFGDAKDFIEVFFYHCGVLCRVLWRG